MANKRFAELLKQMPTIAEAVNSFGSEAIQQRAYEELIKAFHEEPVAAKPAGSVKAPDVGHSQASAPNPSSRSTQDILALARTGTAKKSPENGKSSGDPKPKPVATPSPAKAEPEAKVSPLEIVKDKSNFLRGDIGQELVDANDFFGKDSAQLLKTHGTYQQDNRDVRGGDGHGKSSKAFMFMVRTKIPGGKLTSDQLLSEMDLGDELGNTTLRITSRQGLQLHGIVKTNLQQVIARINDVQLTTLGACGDVNRNVMCCPAPHFHDPVHQQMQDLADQLADHLAPRTRAYHEIWLQDTDGGERELVAGGKPEEIEPIYGKHYLPRKFKLAIGLPGDNCIDIYTNDLGFLAVCRDERIVGFNVLVGGGFGVTPSATKTFPALAKKLCFVKPEQAVAVAEAVVKAYRDSGDRSDRKRARLKYVIHDWGVEKFKALVEQHFGGKLPDPEADDVVGFDDHMGWHDQGNGKWFYGLNVENGRIRDNEHLQLKSALREICRGLKPGIRLTSHQSILFTDIAPRDRSSLEDVLRKHHVKLSEEISTVRRWSMACVAWPTCGLSITEAERSLPGLIDQMEIELARLGLSSEKFTVRMTGCPNGCARPYNSDIGLVGKTAGKYTVFVGGRLLGNRLNFIYKDLVPEDEIVPSLVPLFVYYKQDRHAGESFGDFCHRKGQADLLAWADNLTAAK